MNIEEQLNHDVNLLLQLSPEELRDLLSVAVEVDSAHTQTLGELVAKCLVSISRHPLATKQVRARAFNAAKEYIDSTPSVLGRKEMELQ